jgi:kexin
MVAPEDEGWQKTAAGHFNHKYGFGKLDTYKTVEVAKTWTLVNQQTRITIPFKRVDQHIPEFSNGSLIQVVDVTAAMISGAQLRRIEHITVTVDILHECRGDMRVVMTSPNKVVSTLLPGRQWDEDSTGFQNWTVSSVVHW